VSDGTSGVHHWPGLDAPARDVLTALVDGEPISPGRLAATTELAPAALDAALLDLELAGLIRRTTAGVQAIGLPGGPMPPGVPLGASHPARVLECGGSGGDDDPDDFQPPRARPR
jgi:hypothetical protein